MDCAWNELLSILPGWLRSQVDRQGRQTLQEIRLRKGMSALLIKKDGRWQTDELIKKEDLQYVVNMACRYSPWTVTSFAQGYITVAGGHRIGICGEALHRKGKIVGIGDITSLNIRICRDFDGISGNLWLHKESILILGPPGSGKTTLLRDLIRRRSKRETISVVDERGEIFPAAADFFSGENTDILTGCSKKQGIEMLLRVMGPACIALDEVTAVDDCEALLQAGKCGVSLLATAHAASIEDLRTRPIYQKLLDKEIFQTVVILQMDKSWRTERMEP